VARILITGVLGFAGRKLADLLAGQGHQVFGARLRSDRPAGDVPLSRRVKFVTLDVLKEDRIRHVLEQVRPEMIYHLAAVVPIRVSMDPQPARAMEVNVVGTVNLLEAVRKSGASPRILLPGSSEEYGLIYPHETPVTEEQPLRPSNPYGISGAAQTLLGLQYFRAYGLHVISVRPFNMTGPGQSPDYACPAFARQIARIETGQAEPVVRVGNLSPQRDFNDVRDVMRACAMLTEKARPGEIYNLCSGQARSMREILDSLLAMSRAKIKVQVDPDRVRPVENELVVGDNRKLVAPTGYTPRYSLEQTLADVLDYWRKKVLESSPGTRKARRRLQ